MRNTIEASEPMARARKRRADIMKVSRKPSRAMRAARNSSPGRRGRPLKLTMQELNVINGIGECMDLAHATAVNAGWYKDVHTGEPIQRNVGEVIALMHSELSEALEAHRKDLMDDKITHRKGIEVEFADLLIRVFDTAASMNLDLGMALVEKNRFNRKRADRKLAARRAAGGKRF